MHLHMRSVLYENAEKAAAMTTEHHQVSGRIQMGIQIETQDGKGPRFIIYHMRCESTTEEIPFSSELLQ